jgi:signal transduction histidine kinase
MLNLKRNELAARNVQTERPLLSSVKESSRDRDEILQELFETRQRLQACEQERNNFAARITHDVYIPLTAVQGYCSLLLAGQVGTLNPEQTEVVDRMERGLQKLWNSVEVIDNLRQPAQMSTRLRLGNANFEECLQKAIQEVAPALEKKEIVVKVSVEPPSGRLSLDCQKTQQVLVTLLENSCRFSPRGSSIAVRARSVTSEDLSKVSTPTKVPESWNAYRIDIIDAGSEVRPEDLPEMFHEHAACRGARAGHGLALATSRMIVTAHGGQIWAASNGQGTTFSLLLPTANAIQVQELHLSRMAV